MSSPGTNHLKWAWSGSRLIFNFGIPSYISGTDEAKVVIFYTYV